MEEYLQYMKTLRLQLNDVEDQASKTSIEEQMQLTTIQTMENDLTSVKQELRQLGEDTEQIVQAKGNKCSQILGKQRKIASLESDASTLLQTLELIQQKQLSLGAELVEKSTYYTKVAEDVNLKFQDLQDWVNANTIGRELEEHELVKLETAQQANKTEGPSYTRRGNSSFHINCNPKDLVVEGEENLLGKLESAKAKLSQVLKMKSAVISENAKMGKSVEEAKNRLNNSKPELRAMDVLTLEEEYKALLSDKAGEIEYSQSLQGQIEKVKGISRLIKCTCGEEYKAGVGVHDRVGSWS